MSGMSVYPRVFSLFIVITLLLQNAFISNRAPVFAQESSFVLTGATRDCEGPSASLSWSSSGTMTSVLVTQVNSLAGTSEAVDATASVRSDGWDFEYSLEGMNVVRVDVQMIDGWTYHYEADVTACGVITTPIGGPVSGPPTTTEPEPVNLVVSGAYLVCGEAGGFGFNYSTSREVMLVVYAMHLDNFQQVGDAFIGQSGQFYSQFYNEGTLSFEVAVYEVTDTALANPIDGYSEDLACVPDPPGEPPTATVTVTPSPTADPSAPDPTTPTPLPSEPPVLVPSPPVTPDGAELPAQATITPTVAPAPTQTPQPTQQTFTLQVPDPSEGFFETPNPAPLPSPTPEPTTRSGLKDARIVNRDGHRYLEFTLLYGDDAFGSLSFTVELPPSGPIVFPWWMGEVAAVVWAYLYPFGNILVVQQEPTPAPTPSRTTTEQDDESTDDPFRTLITLLLQDGGDYKISGSTASQSGTGVIQQGTFSANGTIVLDNLPDGTYLLSLTIEGKNPVSLPFVFMRGYDMNYVVSDAGNGNYTLAHQFDSPAELHRFRAAIEPDSRVTSLPETGVGFEDGWSFVVPLLAAIGLGFVAVGVIRKGAKIHAA